jgi:hypothetical protein
MDFHCKFKLAENTSIEALQSFFMEHMNDYESDDEEIEYYLPREGSKPINYAETKWGRWLADPKMNDPHSKLSKLFLLRFCVPYMLFKHFLVPRCVELEFFEMEHQGKARCPIEIKIMACLRLLGRGLTYDDVFEMSEIPLSSIARFLHEFCENVAARFYESCIKDPGEESFQDRLNHYAAIGIPGGFGSVDCTQLGWSRCPKRYKNYATGKARYPTIGFLVVGDHNRNVIYISGDGYLGAMNDINIANMDPFMISLRSGDFKDMKFWMILPDGTRVLCHGVFLISDNGFFQSSVLMDPPKNR